MPQIGPSLSPIMPSKSPKTLYAVFLLAIISLASCTAMTGGSVIMDIKESPENGAFIEGVPFFPQDTDMCGPAALASVIGYWGNQSASASMEGVAEKVYHERLKGTLPIDMLIYAKELGYEASYYRGTLDDIKKKVTEKTPLIIFIDKGYKFYPRGHYIVVTGYNEKMRVVTAHSATNKNEPFSYERLLNAWSKTDYSTLLVRPRPAGEK